MNEQDPTLPGDVVLKTQIKTTSTEDRNSGGLTTASSQEASATTPRKNSSRKKEKSHPVDKIKSESVAIPKLPFEFADQEFSNGVYLQLCDACLRVDGVDWNLFQSMMSVLKSQNPKDHFEAMFMNQMSGVHALVMKFIGHVAKADTENEIETLQRTVNKLMRTFIDQTEALQRYQSRVDQKVTIQNVSVSEGGQAIVGNFTQNANDNSKAKAATTPAAITDARAAPMAIIE